MMTGKDFFRDEDSYFPQQRTLNAGGKLSTTERPMVMGILNITPDSFYSGSRNGTVEQAVEQVGQFLKQGADILDIGGYSTRPGAAEISAQEEIERVVPVIEAVRKQFPDCLISIDTFRSEVAKAAVNTGASLINDVSGGTLDDNMFRTAGALKCPYILMHMRGTPQTMQQLTDYDSLVKDIAFYFSEKIAELRANGVHDIILDPGFGFAKTREQNFELLSRLEAFNVFGLPILAGLSRKSMIWKTLEITAEEALNGTTALNTIALMKGASILRVHDVKEAVETIRLIENVKLKSMKYEV